MYNSGMGLYAKALATIARKIEGEDARKLKEQNVVSGAHKSFEPNYTYHTTVNVSGPPASQYSEQIQYVPPVLLAPEMMYYYPMAGYYYHILPPPAAYYYCTLPLPADYSAMTYYREVTGMTPASARASDTDPESSSSSLISAGVERMITPVKQSTRNYMLEPYVATPTTSVKRMRGRRLKYSDPDLIIDIENISEDETDSGTPLLKKPMTDEDAMNNESCKNGSGQRSEMVNQKTIN